MSPRDILILGIVYRRRRVLFLRVLRLLRFLRRRVFLRFWGGLPSLMSPCTADSVSLAFEVGIGAPG